ncbi:MAG: dTMP kinase [Candidatus Bathyarchaeia archaeon]
MKPSALIVFEGLDQSGKKTQCNLLVEKLKMKGYKVKKLSFPDYETPIGKEIKAFLNGKRVYNAHVAHLLYATNRWEKKEIIEGWLSKRGILLVDRYSPSNLAYGMAKGLNFQWLVNLEEGLPKPNFVIVIDISPKTALRRKIEHRDIHEKDLDFLEKVRKAYISLSKEFGWKIVDGERPVVDVSEDVWKIVEDYMNSL